ncbi:DUF4400 domain-containing protein [Pseudoduganella violacea]|uniref:DUF4400 domain-containing protein n=1 Tax=Pseudoduganella violacea TaxID=1715466 RepID=A0A7W5BFE1_9BURK|nr:DUF4400 domain-containing protein [Pseudoduganella violacea]MBB3122187.1 hypothetical protein [Pseudoduganella violacea]
MIRIVTIASLLTLLLLVLYLPSAYPAQTFLAQIRTEHANHRAFWGEAHARKMLETLFALQAPPPRQAPLMPKAEANRPAVDSVVQGEVGAMGNRLAGNAYFRSLNALVLLATYRLAVLACLSGALLLFLGLAVVDGLVRRAVKGKELVAHRPEVFAACACGVILTVCLAILACVVPTTLPSIALPSLALTGSVMANVALANYHKK